MAVRIIKETERLHLIIDGSTFYYRRVPGHIRAEIMQRHTPRRGGDPNWSKVAKDLLIWALLDWENVLTENGDGSDEQLQFSKEYVSFLPDEIQTEILEKLGANVETLQDELKN